MDRNNICVAQQIPLEDTDEPPSFKTVPPETAAVDEISETGVVLISISSFLQEKVTNRLIIRKYLNVFNTTIFIRSNLIKVMKQTKLFYW